MPDPTREHALRAFAAERHYGPATLERWLLLAPADADALLDLARELRLSENQLRDIWAWAEDIAQRDDRSFRQVLLEDTVAGARQRAVSRNDKLKLVKDALRRMRFPQLAAVEEQLAALVRDLDLPPTVRVSFPEFLEGDAIRIELMVDSPAALHDLGARLVAAAATPACRTLFALLAEAS